MDAPSRSSSVGRGVRDDLSGRIGLYLSDWTDAWTPKVLASTMFIFFTSLAPAITFSLLLSNVTEGNIGAIEVLLSTSLTGILFSVFAGQPLVIVGVTGPVSILTANIYILAKQWGVEFLPFYAWSQIWAAAMMVLLALFNACDSLRHVTRFSCEIFGVLIAWLYLYTGLEGIVKALGNSRADLGVCLLQFIISVGTCWLAQVLSGSRQWIVFNDRFRELISDYGATVAVLVWSAVPTMASDRLPGGDSIPTLYLPMTTSGRPWLVDCAGLPAWAVFAALFPGAVIAVLFFFDHNVSSILTQDAEFKLRKGQAFHYDFLVVGLSLVMTGLLGLPPTNGLIPQAPLHAKSLRVLRRLRHTPPQEEPTGPSTEPENSNSNRNTCGSESNSQGAMMPSDGAPAQTLPTPPPPQQQLQQPPRPVYEVSHVHEQRVSNLLQSLLCGLVCFRPFSDALREIPTAVLYGLFLFLGASSFEGNEMAYRITMVCTETRLRQQFTHPYKCAEARFDVLRSFTALQVVLCATIFGITFTEAGVVFPVLIALLVAVRQFLLPRWYPQDQLALLDGPILPAADESKVCGSLEMVDVASGGADKALVGQGKAEGVEEWRSSREVVIDTEFGAASSP